MNYNEFAKAFKEQIKSYLPAEFKEAEVQTINVKKNNDVEKEGVSMNYSPGISVVFYPEDLYIPYQYGIPFEEIMQKAARGFLDSIISEEQVRAMNFEYDAIKDKLLVAVCNAEKNTELLQDIPHEIREDLALIYKVYMGIDDGGEGFITVNNNLMEIWGIGKEELQKQAWENMHKRLPYNFRAIENILNNYVTSFEIDEKFREELRKLAQRSDLYVLTNEANVFGASYMFDYELLDKIARKLGGDFMVIPSSVHEVLIKKVEADTSVDMVKGIIWNVNREEVRPEEFLSDELYVFDSIEKKLSIERVQDMIQSEYSKQVQEVIQGQILKQGLDMCPEEDLESEQELAEGLMSFEEFKETVVNKIRGYLPKDFEGQIFIEAGKEPSQPTGNELVIRQNGSMFEPRIYLGSYYHFHKARVEMEDILKSIVLSYHTEIRHAKERAQCVYDEECAEAVVEMGENPDHDGQNFSMEQSF